MVTFWQSDSHNHCTSVLSALSLWLFFSGMSGCSGCHGQGGGGMGEWDFSKMALMGKRGNEKVLLL